MLGRTSGSCDPLRGLTTARAFPVAVNVVAGTNAADNANARRRREHIQIDPDLYRQMVASNSGFAIRNQVILTMGGYQCPVTVEILEAQTAIATVRIGVEALARFPGVSLPTTATLTAYAPSTGVSDATAQASGLYYEYSSDNGSNANTILIAPHAGNIEINTDVWAAEMKTALDAVSKTCSIWGGKGYGAGSQSSYDRHHISTVDTDQRLNPVLLGLYSRGWARCIAVHGQSGSARIDIGCPTAVNAFADTLVSDMQASPLIGGAGVTVARSDDTEIAGSDDHNLCNRLAPHSIQIEATLDVRQSATIRGAVNSIFATRYTPL